MLLASARTPWGCDPCSACSAIRLNPRLGSATSVASPRIASPRSAADSVAARARTAASGVAIPVPPDPILKPLGESLFVVWRDRAVFEFSRISERGETLSAEVVVTNAAATELHWARVNLASTQGRHALVKALEEAEPVGDWRPMVDRSTRMVAQHVRIGDPAQPLIAEPPNALQRWAVEGWLPAGQITVLFGDGGAGKSYLALLLALSGVLDRPITPRWRMVALRRAMYLDWETDHAAQRVRLWRLTAGLGSQPQDGAILHRTMRRPLRDEIAAVRAECARHEVDFVVADSLAPASGPEPEHADAALAALQALRSLAVTVLCVAHVSKIQADITAPARPYGSVHIQNLARSTIEARAADTDDEGESSVTLYHRKLNDGRRQPPAGFRFSYDPSGAICVSPNQPDTGGATLAFQILDALRAGPKQPGHLAEELDATPATIKKTLQRLERRDKVMRIGDESLGHHKERLWGLIDTKRDTSRDTSRDTENLAIPPDDDIVPF